MSLQSSELNGSLTVEQVSSNGSVLKSTAHKAVVLTLMRNQFRDIMLHAQINGKQLVKFNMRDFTLHKKFVKDGKATVKLPKQNLNLMLSNCPPDQLIVFLKTLTTKMACQELKGFVPGRQRLLSDKPKTVTEISPLNMKELNTIHTMRIKKAEAEGNLCTGTPTGKTVSRKRHCEDKENLQKGRKLLKTTDCESSLASRPVLSPVILSKEQQSVLAAVLRGQNIFFTGSAGTGKSFLLRRVIGALPPQHTFATASTGVAACHIGGTTLHAFAGMGSGKNPIEQCIELASRPQVAIQWRKCRHLIIDEVSMVDGEYFSKLDTVARVVRKTDKPFGGIQLILCGDFLQLPPVTRGKDKRQYAFQTKAWRDSIDRTMELTEVRRQSDHSFINVLQNIRLGKCPSFVTEVLSSTSKHQIEQHGILATRLCTHKEDVDDINNFQLKKLKTQPHTFEAVDSEPHLASVLDSQCPVAKKLMLKQGSQVMLTKNLNVDTGLVNGARGVITGFENGPHGVPIVRFVCGVEQALKPERWTVRLAGGVILSRKQLPLKLAWAISIHKSQGMSLDCVEMSLARVFECGQAYVALSRARSLQGLRVLDFTSSCVRADPNVLRFYYNMQLTPEVQHSKNSQPAPDHF